MLQLLPLDQNHAVSSRGLAGGLLLALTVFGCAGADDAGIAPMAVDPVAEAAPIAAQTASAELAPCDEVYELRAHGATPNSPYMVAPGVESHPQIQLDAPWGNEKVQAIRWKPITDNKKVIHHWILYAGQFGMLTGWSPGDEDPPYPADVGMDMPTGPKSLRFDMHYYNTQGTQAEPDRSGVEVCVVKGANLRKNAAGIAGGLAGFSAVLAPANKRNHAVTGTCNVRTTQPVYLLTASPHAHRYARHMKFTLKKQSGQEIVMHDDAFMFGEQGTYPLDPPMLVETGDVITTTCVYDNDTNKNITFGESTDNEMCFNFASYYPKGALSCSGGFGGLGGLGGRPR
jgi:hypothetical protein